MSYLTRSCLFLALVLFLASVVQAADRPVRVVSINLCTDQLALMLGDRSQIKSVTFMASDARTSVMHEEATGIPINHGRAEQVLAFQPDLVLAGTFSARYTTALLQKLGYTVEVLDPADNLDDIAENIRIVAKALGYPERGETMIRSMYTRADTLEKQAPSPRPRAVIYRHGGRVAGIPSLGDTALKYAGFVNIAQERRLGSWGSLSMEGLLRSQVDFLVLDDLRQNGPSRGSAIFHHPALRHRQTGFRQGHLDGRSTVCGTPYLLDAAEDLQRQYRENGKHNQLQER